MILSQVSYLCYRWCCGWRITAPQYPELSAVCVCPTSQSPGCSTVVLSSIYPDWLSSVSSTFSPCKVQYNWVSITKLKSHSGTACLKLHPGDLNWSFVCSQTLQPHIYSLHTYSHRWRTSPISNVRGSISLLSPLHCCHSTEQKSINLSQACWINLPPLNLFQIYASRYSKVMEM